MKKALIFCIPALLLATSCSTLDDYDNVNPKAATSVPGVTLINNAQRMLSNTIITPDININPFRLYTQFWAETTYPDESQYIIENRSINRSFWDPLYRDVLSDLKEGKRILAADPVTPEKVKANQLAEVEVMEVYTWSVLVNTFGDIPYFQALDINTVNPVFDDDKVIYDDLIKRLDNAIASFDANSAGLSADLYYGGSTAKWIKFANSLKLRLALTIADVDAAKAATMASEAAPKVFSSEAETAKMVYLGANPNTNQLYVSLIQSGRADFVGTSTFVDFLKTNKDPRLSAFFKPVEGSTEYKGGTYGDVNVAELNSRPGAILEDPTFAATLLSYSEVEFLLAEAVERGLISSGTATEHYNAGVTASILEWGGSAAQAATYLSQSDVAYATAPGTFKQKIGIQKWISLYNNPVEAWKEWRRLDSPALVAPPLAISDIPLRFTYPTTEANLNGANYDKAAAAMGGDEVSSRIFWDKF